MSTPLKACLAVALFLGAILGSVVFTWSATPSASLTRLLGISALVALFVSLALGMSALADYIYGPRSK